MEGATTASGKGLLQRAAQAGRARPDRARHAGNRHRPLSGTIADKERAALLAQLPHWGFGEERGGPIAREFVFGDFAAAVGFRVRLALIAEKNNHHPEWSNVCNRVSITLTTRDMHGQPMNDIELAHAADRAYAGFASARRLEGDAASGSLLNKADAESGRRVAPDDPAGVILFLAPRTAPRCRPAA